MAKKIPVIEIFGPTIQGEGMVIGQKTMFVRTAGCDYSCSWCDSAFTWDGSLKEEIRQMTATDIMNELLELGGNRFSHVTISGGNPALIKGLDEFISMLKNGRYRVALETQGTRYQEWFLDIDDLTISPKPPSSGMKTNFSLLDEMLEKLLANGRKRNISLKVVVFNEEDFQYAKMVHLRYPDISFYLQVGNEKMDEKNDQLLRNHLLKKLEWLIEQTVQSPEMNDARVLPQLHTLIWGNRRGV